MRQIVFSDHARAKMEERGIPQERAISVLREGRHQEARRGRMAARAVAQGIDTEVICAAEGDTIVVVTCYDEKGPDWRPVVRLE